jgi:hypothetical protein
MFRTRCQGGSVRLLGMLAFMTSMASASIIEAHLTVAAYFIQTASLSTVGGFAFTSSSTSNGTQTGANVLVTELFAGATNLDPNTFPGPRIAAYTHMNIEAGLNSSFTNALAAGVSGVAHVTNTSGSTVMQELQFAYVIDIGLSGLDTAFLQADLLLERFNPATSSWDVINGFISNGFFQGEANHSCPPGPILPDCGGTLQIQIAANSSADFRLVSSLRASAAQGDAGPLDPGPPTSGVPEPGTLGLTALAGAWLLMRGKRG